MPTISVELGLDITELKDELETGKTINQVAADHGVPPGDLVAALVAYHAEKVDQAVDDGLITMEQATERLARFETKVTARLDQTWPFGEGCHKGLR